jgi:uncharacterized RDD family membrane protein YckC
MSVRYVGFWARVLASVVDSILLGLVVYPLAYAIFGAEYFDISDPGAGGTADILLQYVLPGIAIIVFWVYRSATPGKMMLKAKIVDADTLEKPETWQWIVRYLGYYVSMFTLFLGFIWVAFDPRKQGFHDKLGRTVVIYESTERDESDLPETEVG